MKVAKPVVNLDCWISSKSCCMQERRQACDKEIEPYVRPKRNMVHLPDSWDTRWIKVKMFRSWKHRCKKKHQWEKHKQTPQEIEIVTGYFPDAYIKYLYCQKKWIRIQHEHRDSVERLIEAGELEPGYADSSYWGYTNYPNDKTPIKRTIKTLEYVRKNEHKKT